MANLNYYMKLFSYISEDLSTYRQQILSTLNAAE